MHEVEQNGVMIVRTPTGIGVAVTAPLSERPLKIEVEHSGRRLKEEWISPRGQPWRDYYHGLDMLACGVRVKDGETVLAELPDPSGLMPWMVLQGPQQHVTEPYVSIPPALHITDPSGAVWTLGFRTAEAWQAPLGEFGFNVLRDGKDVGEVASRIEMRGGRVRIFTRRTGWKNWNGNCFI